jgi:hypothetical protein
MHEFLLRNKLAEFFESAATGGARRSLGEKGSDSSRGRHCAKPGTRELIVMEARVGRRRNIYVRKKTSGCMTMLISWR